MSRVSRFLSSVRDAFYENFLGQKPYNRREVEAQETTNYEQGALNHRVSSLARLASLAWPEDMRQHLK